MTKNTLCKPLKEPVRGFGDHVPNFFTIEITKNRYGEKLRNDSRKNSQNRK